LICIKNQLIVGQASPLKFNVDGHCRPVIANDQQAYRKTRDIQQL